MMQPLGIRNNNPGNIERRKGVIWEGQSDKKSGRFVKFDNPVYGIRAIARVLITYADVRNITTVQGIIDRWAPPGENDTNAYATHVRAILNVHKGKRIKIKEYKTMRALVKGIILHENGVQPYTDAQIDKGLLLAGIEPPTRSLQASRTVRGGQVAGATGIATTVAGTLSEWGPALPAVQFIRDNLGFALMAVGVVVLIGVGYMIWARIDDRRKGLR